MENKKFIQNTITKSLNNLIKVFGKNNVSRAILKVFKINELEMQQRQDKEGIPQSQQDFLDECDKAYREDAGEEKSKQAEADFEGSTYSPMPF